MEAIGPFRAEIGLDAAHHEVHLGAIFSTTVMARCDGGEEAERHDRPAPPLPFLESSTDESVGFLLAVQDVINRKMGDPGAGECHFENYLAQDFESYLAPHGTDADVPGRSAFVSENQGVPSRGRSRIPGHVTGVSGSQR